MAAKHILAATVVAVVMATNAKADPTQYLCPVEASAGLHYEKQTDSWGPKTFATTRKYIFRRLKDEDWTAQKWLLDKQSNKPDWGFFHFEGSSLPVGLCADETNGSISCWGLTTEEFKLDKVSRRFRVTSVGGYIIQGYWKQAQAKDPDGYKEYYKDQPDPLTQPDDAFFEIGTCSSF